MSGLEMLKAYFCPTSGNSPNVRKLENQLQPLGSRSRNLWTWKLCVGVLIVAVLGFMTLKRAVPMVSGEVPQLLSKLPSDFQWIITLVGLPVLAVALGYGLYRFFTALSRKRGLAVYLKSIHDVKKLIVYVSGSGALGFCKAVEQVTQGKDLKELLVFAHPPKISMKKGSVRLMGALIAYAPVQYAMGSHEAAISARGEEGEKFDQAHSAFLDATGCKETAVEWSVIHLGHGHTSISCHTEWESNRSTVGFGGAMPKRFVVLVRDSTYEEPVEQNDLLREPDVSTEAAEDESAFSESARAVVRVHSNEIVGSGVNIDPNGLILTNAHVVGDADEVSVRFSNGLQCTAVVENLDTDADIALVNCIGVTGAPTITLGDSSSLEPADQVVACGYDGASEDQELPVGNGGNITSFFLDKGTMHIRCNAPISPGYSGGALMTPDGKFVGLITSTEENGQVNEERTIALASTDVLEVIA